MSSHPPTEPQLFRLGCAVWAHRGWSGSFIPPGAAQRDWLALYARRMDTVEGNSLFYAVPPASVLQHWASQVPERFRFCPKIPREISHAERLRPGIPSATSYVEHLRHLGPSLGPVFLQLPASYGPEAFDDLLRFLDAWSGVKLLVEVRHLAWFEEPWESRLTQALLERDCGRVILDTRAIYSGDDDPQRDSQRRKPRVPCLAFGTGAVIFVRYISHPELERNQTYLAEWVERVDRWLNKGRTVYFFVHCPNEDHSPHIARHFQTQLQAHGAPVPTLPWDELPPAPEQGALF